MARFIYVEIELDGYICTRRIPTDFVETTPEGFKVAESVRKYFEKLGYKTGQHVKFL